MYLRIMKILIIKDEEELAQCIDATGINMRKNLFVPINRPVVGIASKHSTACSVSLRTASAISPINIENPDRFYFFSTATCHPYLNRISVAEVI